MDRIVQVMGPDVRACCAAVRRHLGLKLKDSREVIRSGGEDGLYRVTLANGVIVEATVVAHARTELET